MAAFTKASGYSNLNQGNFSPTIYSQKVQKFFRRASVVEAITNTDYFGEIANFGDTVNVIKEPTLTVADYARGQRINVQDLVDDQITLTVDQSKYFAFQVDDIEEKQAHINWMDLAISSASYTLKDSFDADILDQMEIGVNSNNTFGTISAATDLGYDAGETSPVNLMARLARLLDDQNVPEDNRFLVAKPVFWEIFANENAKLMDSSVSGDGVSQMRNGRFIDRPVHGFNLYKSNNVPTSSTTITDHTDWSDATDCVIAGHMSSTATVSQIAKTEVLRMQDSFGDMVRGMHMYGRKVLRDVALATAYYKVD